MSDTAAGPGWWQASDEKWYPPEQHPDVLQWLDMGTPEMPTLAPEPTQAPASHLGWSPVPDQPAGHDPWTDHVAASPVAPGASQAPDGRPSRRRLLGVGTAAVVVVVSAVAVPFALRGSGPSFASLPASTILSRSLTAARSAGSVEISTSDQGGDTESIDIEGDDGRISLRSGASVTDIELVGTMVYVKGGSPTLGEFGLSTSLAKQYALRWVSTPTGGSAAASLFRNLMSRQSEIGLLSLTKVTKISSRPGFVSLRGGLPKSSILPTPAVGIGATLTVSTSTPHTPLALYYSESGGLVNLNYNKWGSVVPIVAPRGATPLGGLVSASASGTPLEQAIVRSISLRSLDVPAGHTVQLVPDGNQVTGQVTLDLCSQKYATERLRVARRQVQIVGGDANDVLSTEAIVYSSVLATTEAFAELRQAARNCPSGYVVPPEGPPAFKTTLGPRPDASWPTVTGVQRLAYSEIVAFQGSTTLKSISVYLRRGRVLLALYFDTMQDLPVAVHGQRSIAGITGVFEARLAALRPSAVR